MLTGILPIGTVVLLKNSTKRLMIIGFWQKNISAENEEQIWEYAGCLYPEGYLGPDKTYLFNGEQIERIYAIGYQDEEQFAFKVKLDAIGDELRGVAPTEEEADETPEA